jgi:hypothetical protein
MPETKLLPVGTRVRYTSEITGETCDASIAHVLPDHPLGKVYLVSPTAWHLRWTAWAKPEQVERIVWPEEKRA